MDGIGSRLTTLLGWVPGGLSLRTLDELAGKPKSGLAQKMIADPGYRPTFVTVAVYARALGADVAWLGAGEGDPPGAIDVVAAVEKARRRARRREHGPAVRSPAKPRNRRTRSASAT